MTNGRKDGEICYGQLLDQEHLVISKFTQQSQNCNEGEKVAAWGDPNTEVIPTDANACLVKVFDIDDPTNQYLDIFFPAHFTIDNIRLPDELISIKVVFSESKGQGTDTTTGGGSRSSSSFQLSLANSAKATSSIGITADVQVNIKPHWGDNVPGIFCYFFSPADQSTEADIITRLEAELGETINPWPVFHPETHTVSVMAEQVSLTASGSAQQTEGDGTESFSVSTGKSIERQPGVRSVDIPPCVHRTISISNNTKSDTITATAGAGWSSGLAWPARTGGGTTGAETATGFIDPISFSQTDPPNIPISGWYLYKFSPSFFKWHLFQNTAILVDMSYFQSAIVDFRYLPSNNINEPHGVFMTYSPDFSGGFPDSYAIHSGSLGTGLSLNTTTGVISGTPFAIASLSAVIRATNSKGFVDANLTLVFI